MFKIRFECLLALCLVKVATIISSVSLVDGDDLREGFFNGSSHIRLATPISLHEHIGLSFKSCIGGELFKQQTNGNVISLSVQSEGLLFQTNVFGHRYEVKLAARLLNNAWHAVNLVYRLGNLTLYAGGHQQVIANKTFNPEILHLNLTSKNSVLRIGHGFVGCILEGPSIVFHTSNLQSVNVAWGPCSLHPVNCPRTDPCSQDVCMNHGVCISKSDRFECACTPRYSGPNCEIDNGSPCDRSPCLNGGRCEEDSSGNYTCICDASHSGIHCESESGTKPCETNLCQSNGTCRVSVSNPNQWDCVCLPGFRGRICETNIDECLSNPCRNGGSCTDEINNFTCSCGRTGYKGRYCEININECEPINPCLNQGTCFDNYGGYTCQCPAGFGGQNCELNLNECSSGPCQNGGQCEDRVGSYSCICRNGFTGANCETNINECEDSPSPCSPDYNCIDSIGSYACVCKSGFQGVPPNCTEVSSSSPCPTNLCQNGGACFLSENDFMCTCLPGFTGKTCQINECSSNPCTNGGTCVGVLNGHSCICPEEYFGPHCDFDDNPCMTKPCMNKGTCVPKTKQQYECKCLPGFDGLHCEINMEECCLNEGLCPDEVTKNISCATLGGKSVKSLPDPCASSPCNNGTCKSNNNGDGFTCTCPEGITGEKCETDINECNENRTICNYGICYNTIGGYQCYCRPGYAGNQCDIDIDECLSRPCLHNSSCENKINGYSCSCTPGYSGFNCEIDIDECASNPCLNEGTCKDEVAGFTCFCPPGLTGVICETNIDDCDPSPCQHGGYCIDGINSYECNCTDTGYFGMHCEENIDDCISDPCTNGAECEDLVKDYHCNCYQGYSGKNCEVDINECESSPCQNGGSCLEHSNQALYHMNASLPAYFSSVFDYHKASGYECVCVLGTIGINCEKDINECESNPCHFGSCKDEIGGYKCECEDGYEGVHCEMEIDECDRYKPCVNGSCSDRRNDYYCDCTYGFGGKNCSVELIGCAVNQCKNNGQCLPYLENETEHKFNCSCPNGFHGKICEKGTTMSLSGSSHVLINTTREEGYDIQFRFKTTLPNGLLALGNGLTYYILELINGRLNLRSSLLNKLEGVFVGSGLNDSKWQKVFVAINATHVVLAANEEQTIYPISFNEANISYTSFPNTYLGGTLLNLRRFFQTQRAFIGCTEDVQVNGYWVIPQDVTENIPSNSTNSTNRLSTPPNSSKPGVDLVAVEVGCPREEQCHPNPCHSGGHCTDLWSNFSCSCERPYLGHTCQYNLTAATFGHENITSSYVTVRVNESTKRAVRNIVDISMFIRTRQDKGLIFYLGSEPESVPFNEETFIIAQLEGGELRVRIQFAGIQESYNVGGVKLDNGHSHLIQIVRNSTLVQFRINNTEYFRNTIGASDHLHVDVLYLGGMPKLSPAYNYRHDEVSRMSVVGHTASRTKRQIESPPMSRTETMPDTRMKADPSKPEPVIVNFKGIIQDVQVSNGTRSKWVVEFFPLDVEDLDIPPSFGTVMFDEENVLEGEISDDTCRSNPCLHNGSCSVTWNDFSCNCTRGYKGKSCQEMEFCQLQDCPTGSKCRNLDDGYECVANVTLRGQPDHLLSYNLVGLSKAKKFEDVMLDTINISYRSKTGGTILYASAKDKHYFSVSVFKDEITVAWKLDDTPGETRRFKAESDGNWTSIYLKMKNGKLFGGLVEDIDPAFTVNSFPIEAWRMLLNEGKIYVGGLENNFKLITHTSVSTNSVDIPNVDDALSGYFKGCLGEVRIGNLLLPFFTPNHLYNENFTAKNYFALENIPSGLMDEMGCVLCFDEECKNGGACMDANTTYSCACPEGFAEEDCSRDIDWCEGEIRCKNGATCVDGIANFTCICPLGYTGELCQINIDECASNPCVNGECIDQVGSFKCICNESFSGERCENIRIITCADKPCKKGSSCSNTINKVTGDNYTCNCAQGYVGKLCDVPFCIETPCTDAGLCDYTGDPPKCNCIPGYSGKFCEINIDECLSKPCQNGGSCTDMIDGFKCSCTSGFTGDTCEEDIDECRNDETLCGDGRCNNTIGSYKCICDPQGEIIMCGKNCNISDPCSLSNPCENGGTCVEKCTDKPDYECHCPSGYSGFNCSEAGLLERASPADIAIIVGPIAAFLLLAGGVGLTIFVMMARKKRATRGTYSPSQQEYCNPRVEMDNVLKPPPEERLI